jgi:hypothetical protein
MFVTCVTEPLCASPCKGGFFLLYRRTTPGRASRAAYLIEDEFWIRYHLGHLREPSWGGNYQRTSAAHRCRTFVPRDIHRFTVPTLTGRRYRAVALPWWHFYFRRLEGSTRRSPVVEFRWAGSRSHRSKLAWELARYRRKRGYGSSFFRVCSGTEPRGIFV